jgi:FAD synthetase
MSITTLVSKYITSAEQVMSKIERVNGPINVNAKKIDDVLEHVRDYLEDAKYYKAQGKLETSLTSVAYCEGLLDTLRLLGVVIRVVSKPQRTRIVLASGVFDLLHLGHVKFLEAAKKAGGKNAKLLVIVARDSTVQDAKGRKPVMPENQRLALVGSLKVVDDAVLGLEDFDVGDVIQRVANTSTKMD